MKVLALVFAFILASSVGAFDAQRGLRMRTIQNFTGGPYGDDVGPLDELAQVPTDPESPAQTASESCEPSAALIGGLGASAASNVALGAIVFRQYRKNVQSAAKRAKEMCRTSTDGGVEKQRPDSDDEELGARKEKRDKFECGVYCTSRF